MKRVRVQYFALLREQAGCGEQCVVTDAKTAAQLYRELQAQHGFSLSAELLRLAVDDSFAAMDAPLQDGATLVFIPPVAGG